MGANRYHLYCSSLFESNIYFVVCLSPVPIRFVPSPEAILSLLTMESPENSSLIRFCVAPLTAFAIHRADNEIMRFLQNRKFSTSLPSLYVFFFCLLAGVTLNQTLNMKKKTECESNKCYKYKKLCFCFNTTAFHIIWCNSHFS